MYRIAGNFRKRKLSRIAEKCDFREENFGDCSLLLCQKDATLPNFREKTFANSHTTVKFVKVFSLKTSHYTVFYGGSLIRTHLRPAILCVGTTWHSYFREKMVNPDHYWYSCRPHLDPNHKGKVIT